MRSVIMLMGVAAAYALLRGFPESWPAVIRSCLAVLLLVAGIGFWGKRGSESGALFTTRRLPGWLDYLGIGTAVLAIEFLFLVFLSAAPAHLESVAARVEEWLSPDRAAQRTSSERYASGSRSGNWLWNDEQRRPLPKRANFKQGNRPEIFIQPAAESDAKHMMGSRLYVQAFALSRYRDSSWLAYPGDSVVEVADDLGWLQVAEGRKGELITCRVFHGTESSGQNPLTGLQGLTEARVPRVTKLDEGLRLLSEGQDGYEYDTRSRPMLLDQLEGRELKGAAAVSETWLEIPGGALGRKIKGLADPLMQQADIQQRLVGIRELLRRQVEYSLVIENPTGREPLENFLFHERKGHCELYATAAALLARACGVPARVSYGWVGGTYYESSRMFVFRSREAHAWTEVLIDGFGWVVLDATPPSAMARSTPRVAASDEPLPGELESEQVSGEGLREETPVWPLGLGLAAAFAVPSLFMLGWRFVGRGRSSALSRKGRGRRGSRDYLEWFTQACSDRGVVFPPGMTLGQKLGSMDVTPEFAPELVRYHYGVRYEGAEKDAAREKALVRKIRKWQRL